MKVKYHPRAFVEIYVDGRVSVILPEKPKTIRDSFYLALIDIVIRGNGTFFRETLATGRYEIVLKRFDLIRRRSEYEMNPV